MCRKWPFIRSKKCLWVFYCTHVTRNSRAIAIWISPAKFRRATVNATAPLLSLSNHCPCLFVSLQWSFCGCYIYRNKIRAEEHAVVLVSWAYGHLFGESRWYYIRVLCLIRPSIIIHGVRRRWCKSREVVGKWEGNWFWEGLCTALSVNVCPVGSYSSTNYR